LAPPAEVHYTQKKGEGQAAYTGFVRLPLDIARPGSKPFDVAGLGLNSVDLLAVVGAYPAPNTKQPLRRYARLPGGQIATALVACARLGCPARYIGSFGDDDLGTLSRDSLTSAGVDVSAARVVAGAPNQFAVIIVDESTGERTVLWDRSPALAMTAEQVPLEAVTSGRLLIVDCHETEAATVAARAAKRAGIPTIIDVEKVRPGIDELLGQIDVIIAAEEFPTALTGETEQGRALAAIDEAFHPAVVCVTLGARGSLARCGGREIRTAAYPVECLDSTGAGDVFRGGFAAACLKMPRGDVEEVLAYANAVAALNCRGLGARGGIPTEEDVARILARK